MSSVFLWWCATCHRLRHSVVCERCGSPAPRRSPRRLGEPDGEPPPEPPAALTELVALDGE